MKGPKKKVIILGGGVAGMSAAQELGERGFDVEVYDANPIAGGKARSLDVTQPRPPPWDRERVFDPQAFANNPLPGEHGFRFFPGFYKHITHTMKRIPYRGHGSGYFRRNVFNNLVVADEFTFARINKPSIKLDMSSPFLRLGRLRREMEERYGPETEIGLSREDLNALSIRMWQLLTTCPDRALAEYEQLGWEAFHLHHRQSEQYRMFFIDGITRSLVAARSDKASTYTDGKILVQMMFDVLDPRDSADRLLNGPTNEVWINPWRVYLNQLGVKYFTGARVKNIAVNDDGLVDHAVVERRGQVFEARGDYYILAVPLECVMELLPRNALDCFDPTLQDIGKIAHNVEWMTGLQIYMKKDNPLGHGHLIYVDSGWAITMISQAQFWAPEFAPERYGDGTVKGIFSPIISNWDNEGNFIKKRARDCTPDELFEEVWSVMKASHNVNGEILRDEDVHSWHLDPAVQYHVDADGKGTWTNSEPLLVNYTNTWTYRPESYTRIPNLHLASDYIRTNTDLATMEAANEAARRAVNGILSDCGARTRPCRFWNMPEIWLRRLLFLPQPMWLCRTWKLRSPMLFWLFTYRDRLRFQRGLPWRAKILGWDMLHPFFWIPLIVNIVFILITVPLAKLRRIWNSVRTRGRDLDQRIIRAEYRLSQKLGKDKPVSYNFDDM